LLTITAGPAYHVVSDNIVCMSTYADTITVSIVAMDNSAVYGTKMEIYAEFAKPDAI